MTIMPKTKRNSEEELKNVITARDQYNTELAVVDSNLFNSVIHFQHDFTPFEKEQLQVYTQRVKLHLDFQTKKNEQAHINGPKGAWYTHRSPLGCFMCEDINYMTAITSALQYLAKKYPKLSF